jgi:two-component sensor histidine kinase
MTILEFQMHKTVRRTNGAGWESSAFDRALARIQAVLFVRHPGISLVSAIGLYSAAILLFGERLAISGNYLVLIPLIAAALSYSLPGGVIAGTLGLPANLLLFALIGHPEYAPASKPMAELSGIFVGTALGYLSDYFAKLEAEIERRTATEASLRKALDEKELLLQELHHRVKNNLNVIKSLVQLQKNRSDNPDFLDAADELLGRIFSIALVHEQLYGSSELLAVRPGAYLELLANSAVGSGAAGPGHLGEARKTLIELSISPEAEGRLLSADVATPLGLIVNEILTNAVKHAFEGLEGNRMSLELTIEGPRYRLAIEDNGRGFNIAQRVDGLGLKITRALAAQLGGSCDFGPARGLGAEGRPGSRFELCFPLEPVPKPPI